MSLSQRRQSGRARGAALPRAPGGWHPESGLLPTATTSQTSGVTDTSTRPARAAATRWDRSALQTSAELLLGLSFAATMAFGGYAAATGHLAVFAQGAGIVFLVTLTCVLVSWFRAVEREERADHRVTAPVVPATASASVPLTTAAIAAVDAEYRR